MRRSNKRRKSSSFAKLFVTVCAILAIVAFTVYTNQEDEDVFSVETVVQEQEPISVVTPGFVVEEHRSTIINEDDLEVEEEKDEEEEERRRVLMQMMKMKRRVLIQMMMRKMKILLMKMQKKSILQERTRT